MTTLIYKIVITDIETVKKFEVWYEGIRQGVNLTNDYLGIYTTIRDDILSFEVEVTADTYKQRQTIKGRYLNLFFDKFEFEVKDTKISYEVTAA